MLKITKSIVNGQRALIGFMVRGKESEMGGFSSNEIERGFPIDSMIQSNFSNNQMAVVKSKLVEKGSFKINQLPMCVYAPGNSTGNDYIDIDNSLDLIGRFVQDNENIGFRVKFADGSEDNIKYANVLMLCKWFKPGNFAIRTSSLGKQYICGKKDGVNLNELPATIIGKAPEVTPKRTKSAAKETKAEFTGAVETGLDILDIYNFIKECSGCVIKLPGVNYVAASEDGETISEGFTSLGIGEVANPTPLYSATKLNVNAGFKKVGIVPIAIGGSVQNITTFVYRTKSLFLDGENYMKRFGIAVPTEKEAELLKLLGSSLALKKIEDSTIISPLSQVIDAKSLVFYEVDSSKVDLISEQKRKASTMTAKQLVSLCKKQYDLKLMSKALGPKGGIMKELKGVLSTSDVADATGKKVVGLFSMMNDDALRAVSEAGIDIYTGAYTVAGTPVAKSSEGSSDYVPVEIEYILNGYDAGKLTGAKIIEAVKDKDTTKVSANVIKHISEVLAIADDKARYKAAKKLYDTVEAKLEEISRQFWMHNASMYLNGNKARIHTHDSKHWIPDTSSRVKKAQVYICTASGAEGLTIKFNGVSI